MMITIKEEIPYSMSNFDHTIDIGMSDTLKANTNTFGRHAAWNYNGLVYFDKEKNKFIEEIYRYREHIDTREADTLEELFLQVNIKHGDE